MRHVLRLAGALMILAATQLMAAELVTLSPENYAEYAPKGKEVEAIFGDYVLRNDKIIVVVASPDLVSGRSAGRWGKPQVKGAIIDLTLRDEPNDQLNALWPGPLMHRPDAPQRQDDFPDESLTWKLPGREPAQGKRVTLRIPPYEQEGGWTLAELAALPPSRRPKPKTYVEVSYTLENGWDYVLIETVYKNPTDEPDVPYTQAAKQVWLSHSDDQYGGIAHSPQTTLYHPTAFRDAAGLPTGTPTFGAGMRCYAWYNRQSGRWEIIAPALCVVQIELSATLAPGDSSVTAYLLDDPAVPEITVYVNSADYLGFGRAGSETPGTTGGRRPVWHRPYTRDRRPLRFSTPGARSRPVR